MTHGFDATCSGSGRSGRSKSGFFQLKLSPTLFARSTRVGAASARERSKSSPNRYMISLRIDSVPYWPCPTRTGSGDRLRVYGEIVTAGIRKPIWPKSWSRSALWRSSGTLGGLTWSKNPPHSS